WTFDGTAWSLVATFAPGTVGARGLTGRVVSGNVELFATTAETSANRLVTLLDDNLNTPTFTTLATAAANTIFRGVDFAPQHPVVVTAHAAPATPSGLNLFAALLLCGAAFAALQVKRSREA